ncbi:serine/threonine protein phosphatase [Brachybacterium nesterenkovii]|uniref:serine/threonine protein phosphatase n=1 Tax=Brachybacterium nesterenkovii TaxID=47847 RepID=UPI00321A7EB0
MTDRIDLSEQPAGPAAASAPAEGAVVFDHLRAEDGEHVGYLEIADDGGFIPYDLLRRRRGDAMELDEAEAVLDEIGLRMLAEDWLLREDAPEAVGEGPARAGEPAPDAPTWTRVRIREIGRDRVVVGRAMESTSAHVAKTIDLAGSIEVPLPTERLRPADG